MNPLIRKLGWTLATLLAGAYALFALRGPQGIPALMDKWDQVRQLEQENAELREKIRQKRDRIQELREKESALELEVRKDLQQMKPGEKTLILPNSPETKEEATSPSQP